MLSAKQTKVAADEFNIDFSLACWSGDDLQGLVAILVKMCYLGLQTLVLRFQLEGIAYKRKSL
jgi:hypothetical protein